MGIATAKPKRNKRLWQKDSVVWEVAPRQHKNIVKQILANRGVANKDLPEFLSPDFSLHRHDPKLLPDMDRAIDRLVVARENGEKVGIFGDYDADGTPGAALLTRAFAQLGMKSAIYIPSRDEGYGLNQKGLDHLKKVGCKFVVTVDLGIRSLAEAKYCQKIGLDLIITDHHLPGDEIPKALAVIDPKIKESKYSFSELCGCAVAYKLVEAMSGVWPKELPESFLKWNLDLVGLSTIADVVPLIGENRVLVKFGLKVLQKTRNLGLKALCLTAGIAQNKIGAYEVGFQIAPRINTPGRIDHASKAFELLTTDNQERAEELAQWLNEKNVERQQQMDTVFAEAEAKVISENLTKHKIIVVAGEWSKGVLGPPASRLVERFCRPVILFSTDDEGYSGSARSISGVNIVDLLSSLQDGLTTRFGGHAGAAGVSVAKSKFKKFVEAIQAEADKAIKPDQLRHRYSIDLELEMAEVEPKVCAEIEQLAPFGLGNPKPTFLLSDVELSAIRTMGQDGHHMSFTVGKDGKKCRAVLFNYINDDSIIQCNKKYEIIFYLEADHWNGRNDVTLNIIDLRKAQNK